MEERSIEKIDNIDDIGLYIDAKEKALQEEIRNREVVEAQNYAIKKKIIDLEIQIKSEKLHKLELDKALSKSKANCMTLAIEVKRASQKFWNLKPR